MKRILHPEFRYRPSYDTDVRATFERARREHRQQEKSGQQERAETPLLLIKTAAAGRRFP